jgi:hypothetical protein
VKGYVQRTDIFYSEKLPVASSEHNQARAYPEISGSEAVDGLSPVLIKFD